MHITFETLILLLGNPVLKNILTKPVDEILTVALNVKANQRKQKSLHIQEQGSERLPCSYCISIC